MLLDQDTKLNRYVKEVPDAAWDLIEFSNKPTTLILDGAYNMSSKVIAEDGSVGVRICKQEFCQQLIRRMNTPLVSTSANISGEPSAPNFQDVSEEIKSAVDYIVDLPNLNEATGQASSIIKLDKDSNVTIIRG